jgi:hypothetical protein
MSNDIEKLNRQLNQAQANLGGDLKDFKKKPYYVTGARCFIRIGGSPIAVCQDFRWSVSYNATPIQTVDSNFPWDIDIGQANIQATLNKIYDPLRGPEADGLFSVMAASVHQPLVDIQVLYQSPDLYNQSNIKKNTARSVEGGNPTVDFSMFIARGMFVSISGNSTIGQMSNLSATFIGTTYQNYASQGFTPYGAAYAAAELLAMSQEFISTLSGGFL